jgi:DNA invertase Pin-like site-specific DNA recombinase
LDLIGEHVEVETGKGSDALDRRPKLRDARAVARKAKAAVVAAKLDRLSRDVSFIAGLIRRRGQRRQQPIGERLTRLLQTSCRLSGNCKHPW